MNKLLKCVSFSGRLSALVIDAAKDWLGYVITNVGGLTVGSGVNYTEFEADGRMVLHGAARVQNDMWVSPSGVKAPGTKPATYVDHGINGAWEFSDNTDDTVVTNERIPNRMDRSIAPCLRIKWSSPATDPGDDSIQCVWQVEYRWLKPNEATTSGAEASPKVTTSASTIANGLCLTCVDLSAPEADDVGLVIRIKRLGADVNDTLGNVAHGLGFAVVFISNILGAEL